MRLPSLFSKDKNDIDFTKPFEPQVFLEETILEFVDKVEKKLSFKEALVNSKKRYKFYRSDMIITFILKNKGWFLNKV